VADRGLGFHPAICDDHAVTSRPSGTDIENDADGDLTTEPEMSPAQEATMTCPSRASSFAASETVLLTWYLVTMALLLTALSGVAAAAAPRIDAPYVSYRVGLGARGVAVGNFDGIGPPDLAVTNRTENSVSILLGRGGGAYGEGASYVTGVVGPCGVAVGDFNGDGNQDLVTANTSNNVSVLLGNGNGTFGAPSTFATGGTAKSIAVADLNADGALDLCVADSSTSRVAVLLGNGNGTFQTRALYPTGTRPNCVALGFLNSDGALDAVTANSGGDSVSVLIGNGNGTFGTRTDFSSGGRVPMWVTVGDYSGDGNADLAIANQGNGPGTAGVALLVGNGAGAFVNVFGLYDVGGAPSCVALGDLDANGKIDLVATSVPDHVVTVLYGIQGAPPYFNGGATGHDFMFGAGSAPDAAVLADLSGDGRRDIALVNQGGRTVTLLFNHPPVGPGGVSWFEGGLSRPIDGLPMGCAIGQLDGAGPPDIAVAVELGTSPTDYVAAQLMNSDGTFGSMNVSETAPSPYSVAIGSLDALAPADLAVSTVPGLSPGAISTLSGNGDGTFATKVDRAIIGDCWSVAIGDLNGDGNQDLVGTSGDNVGVLLGHGDGTFNAPAYYSAGGTAPDGVAIGQLNGVGGLDLAVVNLLSGTMCVLPGNGDGTFGGATPYGVGSSPEWVAIGDFNEDGHQDIATADGPARRVSVLLSNGAGGFSAAFANFTEAAPYWVAVADMDGDGHQDLITANPGEPGRQGRVAVLPGHGNGTFATEVDFGTGRYDAVLGYSPGGYSVAVGDLNSDGRPDLAVPILSTPGRLSVFFGLGPTVSAVGGDAPKPPAAHLSARPNPAAGSTTFAFYAPQTTHARLEIFDVAGRLVATPLDMQVSGGPVSIAWNGLGHDGARVPSSVYIARLNLAGRETLSKFIWMK
jgi:VCBS repeat protein